MQPFTHLTGVAVPMIEDDINTDQIAPLQLSRGLKPNYADLLFGRQRYNPDGTATDHVLNLARFKSPGILVAGRNFGCGSSREAAVWCIAAIGIRCVLARSIADIFRENCIQNGLLPIELDGAPMDALQDRVLQANGTARFSVDLEEQTITAPDGFDISFEVPPSDKMRLIEGLDEIGFTLRHDADIRAWETQAATKKPWLQRVRDSR